MLEHGFTVIDLGITRLGPGPSASSTSTRESGGRLRNVDRTQFEALRDLPGKVIRGDMRFAKGRATAPVLTIDGVVIENQGGIDLRLNISFNPVTGAKSFNVHVPGLGPICRLDVDGPAHRPAGRSHKHALTSERCPDRNLPDRVADRPDLSGRSLADLFAEFCSMGGIEHQGTLIGPDSEGEP